MNQHKMIMSAVCSALCAEGIPMTVDVAMSRRRDEPSALARHLFVFMARQHTPSTYEEIGAFLKRNHSTAVHSDAVAVNMIELEGAVGRAYLSACDILGFRPPEWLHPKTGGDRNRKPLTSVSKMRKRAAQDQEESDLGPEKVPEWTPEQKKRLQEYRKLGEAVRNSATMRSMNGKA